MRPEAGDWLAEAENARILLVEDEMDVRLVWERSLLAAGYGRTESVGTVREAVGRMEFAESLRQEGAMPEDRRYDLVILDLSLSPKDIFQDGCLAGLAMIQRWPDTRLLFVSGYDRATAIERFQCPASIPLFEKPDHIKVFLARVATQLSLPPWRPEIG